MLRLSEDENDKKSMRDTLLSSDSQSIFECNQEFQTSSSIPFLDLKVLQKLFTYEDISLQDRVRELKNYGGLIYLMNGLKVWYETGLTRFSSFSDRARLYGVNYESPNSVRKYLQKLKSIIKNGGLLGWFICIWKLTVVIEYFFGEGDNSFQDIMTIVMLTILILAKMMVKNFVNSDINKCLSYSKSDSWVKVRREGRIVRIQQSKLLVGDILLFSSEDSISVDGIIIKCSSSLCVDQYKTISEKFNAIKSSGWNVSDDADPFIFAGTQIVYGEGQMLVCCVGQQCTFRTVTKSNSFIKKKTKYIREGEARYIVLSRKVAQGIISVVIYFKILILLIDKSPLIWAQVPALMRSFIELLSWALILQDMHRIQFIYCFIQKRTYQQRQFKIINKLILGQLLKLDVLLVDEGMLEIHQHHITRQNRHIYHIQHERVLSELNTVVDIKIMTEKPILKCRQYKLNMPYSINRQIVDLNEIKNLQDSKFICHVDPSYYISFLVKAFRALDYKVGVVPINAEDILDNKVVIISTDDSKQEVQNISWVKLNSSTCEEGLLRLYQISTNFYILMAALMNQHFLSIVATITGALFISLPTWVTVLLVVVQIVTIFTTFMIITLNKSECIETGQSFQSNFIAHHLTIIPFFLYAIYSIRDPTDVAIFMICRNIVSVVYNTRMGQILQIQCRRKLLLVAYGLLIIILTTNFVFCYIFSANCRQQLVLIIMVVAMNLIYLAQKNYNNTMRQEPHVSFN